MRIIFNTITMIFLFGNLVYCKNKDDMISPNKNNPNCDCPDTTHFFIENTSNETKSFRIYGGNTNLPFADDNTDPAFTYGLAFDNNVNGIAIQPDGKILVGGLFSSYNGVNANRIIRLNSDGSIDNTFNSGSGFDIVTQAFAIQSDGKILVGGLFLTYNGVSANNIIRLNSDGSRDNTFNIGTGFDGIVNSIVIQPDGKILVGGSFENYNGTGAKRIIRLNSDGTRDTSFIYGGGFDSTVSAIALQSDGKMLVGGGFTNYQGVGANGIIRLNSNASIDGSFNYGTGFNSDPTQILLLSDGTALVAGFFTEYKGTSSPGLIKLNSDGSINSSLNVGTGFDSAVRVIYLQSNGKIIAGGSFTSYNGNSSSMIARLNSDGSFDSSFDSGTGFNDQVYALAIQSDNKILMGGFFTSYDGTTANHIVRLDDNGPVNNEDSDFVTAVVNGGINTLSQVNADSSFNPISICNLKVTVVSEYILSNIMYKKEMNAQGKIESVPINLISKVTAYNKQFVVEINGSELNSTILDGSNYIEWSLPANTSANIEICYSQYKLSNNLKNGNKPNVAVKNKKRYIHAVIRN